MLPNQGASESERCSLGMQKASISGRVRGATEEPEQVGEGEGEMRGQGVRLERVEESKEERRRGALSRVERTSLMIRGPPSPSTDTPSPRLSPGWR